jgi:hypothetical protein
MLWRKLLSSESRHQLSSESCMHPYKCYALWRTM